MTTRELSGDGAGDVKRVETHTGVVLDGIQRRRAFAMESIRQFRRPVTNDCREGGPLTATASKASSPPANLLLPLIRTAPIKRRAMPASPFDGPTAVPTRTRGGGHEFNFSASSAPVQRSPSSHYHPLSVGRWQLRSTHIHTTTAAAAVIHPFSARQASRRFPSHVCSSRSDCVRAVFSYSSFLLRKSLSLRYSAISG